MTSPYYLEPTLPEGLDSYQELVWHLHRLPGGAAAAVPDFFGGLLAAAEPDCWTLVSGGRLAMTAEGGLRHDGAEITHAPAALLHAAAEGGVSPLVLTLLALALGYLEGERQLKSAAPQVRKAAQDLMLMTVCRLCG